LLSLQLKISFFRNNQTENYYKPIDMKKVILTSAAALSLLPLYATHVTKADVAADDKIEIPDSTGFKFTDIKLVKTTPVKDQNKSGTCWSFAGISFLEDEVMHKGGPELDLSEMFVVRKCYEKKADKYVRMDGKINFAQGGALADVIMILKEYGVVPESDYTGLNYGEKKHVHDELADGMESYLNVMLKNPNKKLSTAWKSGLNGILDAYLGQVPESFTYNGKSYTPRSFADMLGLNADDYICLTSYTHHPFYTPFALEVADNWTWATSQNVPLDELKKIVDNAIDNDYSVAWAADVSEGGFKWRKGYAVLPEEKDEADMEGTELSRWVQLSDKDREESRFDIKGPVKEQTVTQESRQKHFDNRETTDDHGMVIVGIAQDQEGNRYYKVKNSWDTNQLYGGYFYVSEPYFLDKTLSILVNKKAVPKDIAKKVL
jgi:bleomycin hydrolase